MNWAPTDLDERTFRESYRYFKDYWTRSGLERVCPIEWIDLEDNAERPFIARSLDCLHPSGSARMGDDPTTSVVDPHLRCHDVVNLHVAGAATFPGAGSANPNLTIMQLALRAADACMKWRRAGGRIGRQSVNFAPIREGTEVVRQERFEAR